MSLDINRIINEAIEETITENEENEVLEEISEKAKKAALAAGAAAAGAGAATAAYAGKDKIADAADAVAEKAKGAVSPIARYMKNKEAGEYNKKFHQASNAANKELESAKVPEEEQVKDNINALTKFAQKQTKQEKLNDEWKNLTSKTTKQAKEFKSAEGKPAVDMKDVGPSKMKMSAAAAAPTKETDSSKVVDYLRKYKSPAEEDRENFVKSAVKAGKKAVGALTNESAIEASAIAAGLGAKTLLEQLRKVAKSEK